MKIIAVDIGSKNTIICKWIKDPYNVTQDGIPICIPNNRGRTIYNTCLFFGKEMLFNDTVGSRITSSSDRCISGCFQLFLHKVEEDLAIESVFNPSKVFIKEGIVHFNIEVEDSEVREIPVFVPTSYFLENVIFSAFKTQDSIISQRHEIARQHSEDVDWYLIIPDNFDTREIEMLKSVIQWKNYNRFILTKSCIAPLIEYGYYNLDDPDTKVCLFIDSGDSHTTFTIAEISGPSIQILYHYAVQDISGRIATLALLQYVCGEAFSSMDHKTCLSCLSVIEKAKMELNVKGVDDVYVDLYDVLEEEAFEDEIYVTKEEFNETIAEMMERFSQELAYVIEFVESIHKKINQVFPLGGNCHLQAMLDILVSQVSAHNPAFTKFNLTLNPTECFAKGTTLLGNLIDQQKIWIDSSLLKDFIFPTLQMETKIKSVLPEQAELLLSLHPDCYFTSVSKETPSFEHFHQAFLSECRRINETEATMQSINELCEQFEHKFKEVDLLLEQAKVWKDFWTEAKTADDFVQSMKERIIHRYNLTKFPPFFEIDKSTKNSTWWKDQCEGMKAQITQMGEFAHELIAFKEQSYSSLCSTSRMNMDYSVVSSEYYEFIRLIDQFQCAYQKLDNKADLTVYHFFKKAHLKKKN